MRALLEKAFKTALHTTEPKRLLMPHLQQLATQGQYPHFILALGKAACSMAEAALEVFPEVPALIISPEGTPLPPLPQQAKIYTASHPIPDQRSEIAAKMALTALSTLHTEQLALILVSGGGSALLAAPQYISLAEKQELTTQLLKSGASIQEINTVRQIFSKVKGGRLAQATSARIHSFFLSDIVGDPLELIASGPTVPTFLSPLAAIEILDRYQITAPKARQKLKTLQPLSTQPHYTPQQHLIGSNRHLLKAAQDYLTQQNIHSVILADTFTGEAKALAKIHADLVHSIVRYSTPFQPPVVLLSGGETTVTVQGQGCGGRNQEFALAFLQEIQHSSETNIWCLSAGSDGIDGNSKAAGAFITPTSYRRAKAKNLHLQSFLDHNDSNSFFVQLNDQFITGTTGHNLNDFRAIAIGFEHDTFYPQRTKDIE